jgi:transcriptional regulator with XRE-family HTH domain
MQTNPLKLFRSMRGLTQGRLAALAGVNIETICRAERYRDAFDRLQPRTRVKLAAALGVPLRELEQFKHIAEDDRGIVPSSVVGR